MTRLKPRAIHLRFSCSGRAPGSLTACHNAALNPLREAIATDVAVALRPRAVDPRQILAYLGIIFR